MLFTQNVRDKETGEEELNSILNYILVLPTAVKSDLKKDPSLLGHGNKFSKSKRPLKLDFIQKY